MTALLAILKKVLIATAKKALTEKAFETVKPYLPKDEVKKDEIK